MAKKSKRGKIFTQTLLAILLPVVTGVLLTAGWLVYYHSRAIPDLGEQNQMTMMPTEFSHVLGIQTNGNINTPSFKIPIFLYHYVEYVHDDPGRQNLTIPPNILIQQIETLKNAGYTFITTSDVTAALSGKEKLSTTSVMLTFDDGYMDFYTDVYPILQKEKVKAVAYIVPNFLDRPNYMFTSQLEEVAKSPLVEIGAHTMDHYALAGMDVKEATYEITQSRKFLQNLLHLPINSFAYPYGSFDKSAIQIVKDAGFSNAVSVIPGIMQSNENEYYLFRLRPGYRYGEVLLEYLKQTTFQPW